MERGKSSSYFLNHYQRFTKQAGNGKEETDGADSLINTNQFKLFVSSRAKKVDFGIHKALQLSEPGFFDLCPADILRQTILCFGGLACALQGMSNIPGYHSLDVSSNWPHLPTLATEHVSRHHQVSLVQEKKK